MQDSLPAGGLRLYREGVEPSGSLRKVSGYVSILLSRTSPVARVIWPKPLELLEVVFYSVCRFCAQRAVWVWAQVWARGRFPSRNGLQRRERRHGGDYDDDSGDRARSKRFRRPPRRGTLCAATIWMVLSVDQDG